MKIDVTRSHNEELDVTEMMSNSEGDYLRLKEDDITQIIRSYDFQGLSGLGLMFNVESFNKQEQKAAIWVTFIDLASKDILLTERFIERAGGSGLRNYWSRAVFDAIDRIKAKSFDAWRKKYSR
jgi:hypothetical protein